MRARIPLLQKGGFLLEALIGILIFAFGTLGIVALQGRALKFTNDSQFRAEAVYLTNTLLGRMWADDRSVLAAQYAGPTGPQYLAFKALVTGSLPNADATVEVDPAGMPVQSSQSDVVHVIVSWQSPGEDPHRYETWATVGKN